MAQVIGWCIMLFPIVKALLTKVIPKLLSRFRGVGRNLTGNAAGLGGGALVLGDLALGDALKKGGAIGAIFLLLTRIWAWLGRFPAFLKGLFATGGVLYFLRPFFEFIVGLFKTPVLVFLALVTSAFFPTILEKIFLVTGAVCLKIFLFFFKIGKQAFIGAVNSAGDGGGIVDEFRDAVLGSFDELPTCMIQTMGYIHFIEDLGMIVTTASLLAIVSAFRIVYGAFGGVKPLGYFT